MKKLSASLIALPLVLTACTTAAPSDLADNPLYAEWYNEDLVEHIVNLEIAGDESLKDPAAKAKADEVRADALAKANAAEDLQLAGVLGDFITVKEETTGEGLLLENTLYLGPNFLAVPGVELHLILSPAVDPTDVPFPAEDDLDLGILTTVYGPQQYRVPAGEHPDFRSLVLYDAALSRIHGFAQLRKP